MDNQQSEQPEQSEQSELHAKWKQMAYIGPLPENFLKIQPDPSDRTSAALFQNYRGLYNDPVGRLSITVTQAKLVKNYGLSRMDPYVRLRVGHTVYETHTDVNGGKNPRWNKHFQCVLPPGVEHIYVEIYDECSFTMDELIAWGYINIPPLVMNGETHEDWFTLTGKQGENQEGMINIIFSYNPHGYVQTVGPQAIMLVQDVSRGSLMNPYGTPRQMNVVRAPPTIAAPTNQTPAALPSTLPSSQEELKQYKYILQNLIPFLKSVTIYFILRNDEPSLLTAFLKCFPIMNLIVFHWTTIEYANRQHFSHKIFIALILCCFGDLLLVWPHYFAPGMLMFALAHFLYMSAYGFTPLNGLFGAILQLSGFYVSYLLMPKLNGILTFGVPIYIIILVIMAWRAMSRITPNQKSWSWTAISSSLGGIFFIISDTILGFHNFHSPFYYGQIIIMVTYYLAQLGLTLSSINV